VAEPELSFAGLLRQLRTEATLTQEELAAAAGVSSRSVSDLERGFTRTAHKDTGVLLAGALGLPGPVRELFVAAARGRAPAARVLAALQEGVAGAFAAAATRALPRDIAAFTGRQAELAQLMGTLAAAAAAGGGVVNVHAVDGMAGIGKTTFAVHAAHRLAGAFPDGQFFLPLHAHTPGRAPVGPGDALASLLLTAGVTAGQIPPGLDARAGRWRDYVAGKKILLLLDDAAGHEQVQPLLPGTAGSLVLITSRRRLTALHGTAVISLDTFPPAEAATLLVRLAARPGLRASDAAVGQITRLCGYLPLAIGMLASQLRHHPAWTAGQLADGLASARDRLAVMHAENVSVAAAFGLSYADLTTGSQRLFRRLGLVPGPHFDAHAAAALDDTSLDQARRHLGELYDQHLVAEPAPGRYLLHDLLREHARALAAVGDPAESDSAVGRLLDYYLHTALAAGQHISRGNPSLGSLPPPRPPACAPALSAPGQAATWLEAERANLHAAADYAAANELPRHAMLIPAAMASFLALRGHFDQAFALHQTALAAARRVGDRPGQARALMLLSDVQFWTGDSAAGAAAEQALALFRDLGDRAGQGDALNGLAMVHRLTGHYPAAVTCHQQALDLFRDLGDQQGQADILCNLSHLHCLTGDYLAARACVEQALELSRAAGDRTRQASALQYLGMVQRLAGDYEAATASQQQSLELYCDLGHLYGQAWTLCELGILQRLRGDYPAAAASEQQALGMFCDAGDRWGQGHARNTLGLIQQLTGDYEAAAASHQRALWLFRDSDDPQGQAEALNSLGELASRTSATGQARDRHGQALAIARDIGAPLEEARALEGIGHSHLHDGNPRQAAVHLQQALAIYQRIGAHPAARRVQETLQQHQLTASTAQPGTAPASQDHPRQPPAASPASR
jgi:tetratricopeptide (TPR) repeat protein/transcriptional regulator with XRE-family HTH domain